MFKILPRSFNFQEISVIKLQNEANCESNSQTFSSDVNTSETSKTFPLSIRELSPLSPPPPLSKNPNYGPDVPDQHSPYKPPRVYLFENSRVNFLTRMPGRPAILSFGLDVFARFIRFTQRPPLIRVQTRNIFHYLLSLDDKRPFSTLRTVYILCSPGCIFSVNRSQPY